MSSSVEKFSPQALLKSQNIIYMGVAWSVAALLFFLLFSIKAPNEDYPLWYSLGTYIFEIGAFAGASWLCYRNWKSPQIASGRNVWLGIGLGMLTYALGGVIFGIWELVWNLDPDASPADLFYIASYVLLGWGMFIAVLPRRLNLENWQWGVTGGIALVGIAFAVWVSLTTPADPIEQVKPLEGVPMLVINLENFFNQFSWFINLFYIIGDVVLLIVATTLLMAFWGGKFSKSWTMIAGATFCLYVADMWFKYAATLSQAYESGGLLEVGFVISGALFAIGAVLEYDISTSRPTRSRRGRGGAGGGRRGGE